MLAHRTGIARHDVIWHLLDISRSNVLDILRHLDPACELRQDFQYNNFMYSVAGLIIEKVTGQTWEESLTDRIFVPLGMESSHAYFDQLETSADVSLPYAELEGNIAKIPYHNTFPVNPGAGINSSVLDLLKWVQLHLCEGNLIPKQILKEMHTVQMPFPSNSNQTMDLDEIGYGLGWFIGNYKKNACLSHGGLTDGFCCEISLLPGKQVGVVILTNSSTDGQFFISCIRNQIFDHLLELPPTSWLSRFQEKREMSKRALQMQVQQFHERSLAINDSCPLQEYAGIYEHAAYGVAEIKIQDEQLFLSYGKVDIPLYPKSESVFTGQFHQLLNYGINPFVDLTFVKNGAGVFDQLEIPFESFRSAKPIIFNATIKRTSNILNET